VSLGRCVQGELELGEGWDLLGSAHKKKIQWGGGTVGHGPSGEGMEGMRKEGETEKRLAR
jgi:hypothetical protein